MPSTNDPHRPDTVPIPLTSFVGREREIAALADLVRRLGVRLVTLTGPGGVGKTRLAIRAAAEVGAAFPDGVWFVPLAPVRDLALVPTAIARALDVRETGTRTAEEGVRAFLRERRALLILDNFEQVLDAGPIVAGLLVACPALTILVTSRAALRVSGEQIVAVPPLSLPRRGVEESSSRGEELNPGDSEAMHLFVERARGVQSELTLTETNAATIAAICQRLEGLPLAIELAAARTNHLPLPALLARLEQRLSLLTGGPRDQPPRLRAMRDAIAWSHDLLTDEERALFRRLAVFVGGFTLDAVAAVRDGAGGGGRGAGVMPPASALDLVGSLVDKSLVRQAPGPNGEPRYGMLETIREYGLEQLASSGEEQSIRAAHAAWFLALAERTAPELEGLQAHQSYMRLEREQGNLRAALTWFDRTGDAETLLRLAAALGYYWEMNGPWSEGIGWLERALALAPQPSSTRVIALGSLGQSAAYLGDFAGAERALREGLELAQRLGLRTGGIHGTVSALLASLGALLIDRGHYVEAETVLAEAVTEARRAGDRVGEAYPLTQLGIAAWGRGDVAMAASRLEAARAFGRTVADQSSTAVASRYLAHVAIAAGDFATAAHRCREFASYDPTWLQSGLISRLVPDVAALAMACGLPEQAATLFGAAEALAESTGIGAVWPERGMHERALVETRRALGDAFAAPFAVGRRLTRPEIVAAVTAVLVAVASSTTSSAARAHETGLTPRELEVLRLVAAGQSNAQIADALFISVLTVKRHLTTILAKLGVENRTAAAVFAHGHRLV